MASKPKALLKHAKQKHKKEQVLNTADDYQAAGVDFEDAAGKWRAGDAVKSMRFFQRALEVYEQGLQRFPQDFDLAYNKARVQLEVATHPVLVKQLQQPVLSVLQTALISHRYAISLNQGNADTLFNTSQVLTSIAEELANGNNNDDAEALRCLEEAVELQDRCFSLQELQYEKSKARQNNAEQLTTTDIDLSNEDEDDHGDGGGVSIETVNQQEDQWFSIVEPVTEDTLIDTALAQLNTLASLCRILCGSSNMVPHSTLPWIEEYSLKILQKRLPILTKDHKTRLAEIALMRASFVTVLLEAGYRAGKLDIKTYKSERDGAFLVSELGLDQSAEALLANATSLMAFSTASAESRFSDNGNTAGLRWNALSAAITNLTAASKVTGVTTEDLAKSHFLRGECSLYQYQMSQPPTLYENAVANATTVLKNSQVFYRNASKLFPDAENKSIACFRSVMAQYLQTGDRLVLQKAAPGRDQSWLSEQLEDMISEGLLAADFQV